MPEPADERREGATYREERIRAALGASNGDPRCAFCRAPATCFGEYETCDGSGEGFACDECCGCGNEDGWCEPLHEEATDAA